MLQFVAVYTALRFAGTRI